MSLIERLWGARGPGALAGRPPARELARFPERNPNPVLLLSHAGQIVYANPACARELQRLGLGHDSQARLLPPGCPAWLPGAWASAADDLAFEYPLADRVFAAKLYLLRAEGLAHVYLSDVTDVRRAEERLVRAALHDPLTELGNRPSFEAHLEQALAERAGGLIAVILIDLDRLRLVNDSLGHEAGDQLLRHVAVRLSDALRLPAQVPGRPFRFQGDTFAALVSTRAGHAGIVAAAESLMKSFAPPFEVAGSELFVTASVGIALAPGDGSDVPTLLRNADSALNTVKQRGGNGFRCYATDEDKVAREWLALASGLRLALARGDFFLAYQPQVDLKTLREVGREALLRWQHPEQGEIPPARFVPVAEESGGIIPLGSWVLRTACGAAAGWDGPADMAPLVAVNVSARQFHEPDFPQFVAQVLKETALAPQRLELEITESVAMAGATRVAETLHELKRLGVRLAIDDFGTGYSSLSYLQRFPIDRLKLDQSFVHQLGRSAGDDAVAQAIIDIGHRLGVRVLAEGVETEEQLGLLRSWGCDEAQGFLFGPPRR